MRRHATLEAWLPTARQVGIAELLTVTAGATTWRYASSVDDVVDGADTYLGSASVGGLIWDRTSLTFKSGVELSDCTVTLHPRAADTINALPVAQALDAGVWDTATLLLSRAYFDDVGALVGVLDRYAGRLGKISAEGGDLAVSIRPLSDVFNRQVPPVYQAGCANTLYDTGCGVDRSAWTVAGTVQTGSTATTVYTGLTVDDGYYTGGVVAFTSGPLLGVTRTVRNYSADGGAVTFWQPLPSAPAVGDAVTLTPGCDRSLGSAGCARFDNRLRYRGQPYIPPPETAV